MSGYKLVVLTDPVAGREDEYNDWYSSQHLADVLRVPGFSAAQRFSKRIAMVGDIPQQYLAIYELDVEGPEAAARSADALTTTQMPISEALDLARVSCGLFAPCGERKTPGAEAGPYRQLAFTAAVEGREDAFNDWYNEVHVRELMDAGGIAYTERSRLQRALGGQFENPFLAVYSLEAQDWPGVEAGLQRMRSTKLTMTDTGRLDRTQLALYEACSPRVTAAAR